jgi:hypothetical protein
VQALPSGLPAGLDQDGRVGAATLPTLDALAQVLPGGFKKGSTVTVEGGMSLVLALLAGPSAAGLWGAVVGVPEIGLTAGRELGVDLDRLVLIPHPGDTWATVVAALADAIDVVVVRPPRPVRGNDARRLAARVRQRGCVLVCLGEWEGADLRLTVTDHRWEGIGSGHGRLRWHAMTLRTGGRGAAAIPRTEEVWLHPHPPTSLPYQPLQKPPSPPRERSGVVVPLPGIALKPGPPPAGLEESCGR